MDCITMASIFCEHSYLSTTKIAVFGPTNMSLVIVISATEAATHVVHALKLTAVSSSVYVLRVPCII
jgi:hypothetical protein